MASVNYIFGYYHLQNHFADNGKLSFFVHNIADGYYRNQFSNIVPKKQRSNTVVNALCKMHFLINLCVKLGINQIPNEVFLKGICSDKSQIAYYKRLLKLGGFIDYTQTYNLTSEYLPKKHKVNYKSETSVYNVLGSREDFNSLNSCSRFFKNSCIQYTYSIDNSFLDLIKSKVHLRGGVVAIIDIRVPQILDPTNASGHFSRDLNDDGLDIRVEQNVAYTNANGQFLTSFVQSYKKLTYCSGNCTFDNKKTAVFYDSPCRFNDTDFRFYHPFHNLKKEMRKQVKLDDEPLVENFDVHNCHYALLNALIKNERSIPQEEKDKFWELTVEQGQLYESFVEFVHEEGVTRDRVKTEAFAKYLNYKNDTMNRLRRNYENPDAPKRQVNAQRLLILLDIYFETVFPNIRKFIYTIRNKDYKALHYEMNKIETSIITFGIAKELYEKYGVLALTLHDGIYMKQSDADKLKRLGVSTEIMFKEYLKKL